MALDCRQRERRTCLICAAFAAGLAALCALSPALSAFGDETKAAKAQPRAITVNAA